MGPGFESLTAYKDSYSSSCLFFAYCTCLKIKGSSFAATPLILLFKIKFSEELGAVETWLGPVDSIPRNEVRGRKIVAAFVEIGTHLLAAPTVNAAAEECCCGSGCRELGSGPT